MKTRLFLIGLVLLSLVGYGIYEFKLLEPARHTNYALEKVLERGKAPARPLRPAVSVEAAYQAVGSRRTPYAPEQARVSRDEKDYFVSLLTLTDAALAERVAIQTRLQAGEKARASNYEAILERIKGLPSPDAMIAPEALIYQAIDDQRRYFEDWKRSGQRLYFDPGAPLVLSSHKKLSAAKEDLLRTLDGESQQNRRALADHLGALDFR